MQVDIQALRRHYASLSDDELLVLDREELTDAAQACYDEELTRRGLAEEVGAEEQENAGHHEGPGGFDAGAEPDWLEDAACACTFASQPGGSAASDAENARFALEDAGIPCQVSVEETAPATPDVPAQYEYRVMVPGALTLTATSVLDKEVFNPQLEADWRTHFEALTDDQLVALHPDVICAGLVDRIARLKRVYNGEIARRRLRVS